MFIHYMNRMKTDCSISTTIFNVRVRYCQLFFRSVLTLPLSASRRMPSKSVSCVPGVKFCKFTLFRPCLRRNIKFLIRCSNPLDCRACWHWLASDYCAPSISVALLESSTEVKLYSGINLCVRTAKSGEKLRRLTLHST